MNGDEQIRLGLARAHHAFAQADVIVAVAGEHAAHIGLFVDHGFQPPRDLKHHILFVCAAAPVSAGILAAVTGVDHDHDVPRWPFRGSRDTLGRRLLAGRLGYLRQRIGRCLGRTVAVRICAIGRLPVGDQHGRCLGALGLEIDHQPIAVIAVGVEHEAFRGHLTVEIEYYAQIGAVPHAGAYALDQSAAIDIAADAVEHARIRQVNNQPQRVVDHEQIGVRGATQVKDHPRLVRRCP